MIHSKCDAPVSASDKRSVLPDDVMKYQVCFIVAIDGSRNIRNDTPLGMRCNVTLSSRFYFIFFSLRPLRSERSAHLHFSLSMDRKAEDGRCRLRLSVIPWNRTCYCKLLLVRICDR